VAETLALLEAGGTALASGDWVTARSTFAAASEIEETPEAILGLGNARWWLGEIREAMADWERAYAGFVRRPDPPQAVVVAVTLSLLQNANFGNRVVSAGWAARAERLADGLGAPTLDAWVLLARSVTCDDPGQVELWGQEACDIALEAGDRDLELCALSVKGAALLDAGRVEEGAALLDEALTGALGGEVESLDTVVFTACVLMQSCVRGADFARVVHWSRALDTFTERYGCPYVFATCRAHYGAVLVATGDWARAEEELQVALRLAGDALPAVRAEASAFLADLRLAQGRVEDARGLVVEFEEHPVVLAVLAASCLASGEAAVAVSMVQRRLGAVGSRILEEGRLREVLGEAFLASGDVARAVAEGRHLVGLGRGADCELITARGERLLGRALTATDPALAEQHLDAARVGFAQLEMSLEVARCRFALAEVLRADKADVALAEARAALAAFEDLGAGRDADRAAAWLRAAGAAATRIGPKGLAVLTKREHEVLGAVGKGLTNPEIAERLYISRRTVEHHVASILSKLGLRNRTEIATFATKHDGSEPTSK
jgi:DNA-binding CsgD family transcriptional regulator